jgi:transposase
LFVKKPCRIEGLLMVMTLALPVYSVTQRRLRQQLAGQQATVPNQLQQQTERPTLRWVFQRLEGIHRVRVTVQAEIHDLIEGLNEVTRQVLRLFGERVCRLDHIAPG